MQSAALNRTRNPLFARLRGTKRPARLIFLYHRVAELASDPSCSRSGPRTLRNSLPSSASTDARRRSKRSSTIAATSRLRAPWWLERLLLLPGRLPAVLRLRVGGTMLTWDLGTSAVYTDADYASHRGWTVEDEGNPTPQHGLYRELCARLRNLSVAARERTLDDLAAAAGVSRDDRPTHRAMSSEDVRSLATDTMIDIGAHTISHPTLAALPIEEQREEIAGSRGQPVDRHYIERFLSAHASDVRGAVLEVGDNEYTRRFGGERVTTSDVLHVETGHPGATMAGRWQGSQERGV